MHATALLLLTLAAAGADAGDAPTAHDRFLENLLAHCTEAYAGRVVANEPVTGPDPFADRYLVLHVAACGDNGARLTFFVSDDTEREWIVKRTERGLQLRHTHRTAEGSPLSLTNYGGETVDEGTATRQEFPADPYTVALFEREDLEIGIDNVWAMEIEPGKRLTYELSRDDGRLLRIEFDLAHPVEAPETALTLAAKRAADDDDWDD